jgi:hypothetical protein
MSCLAHPTARPGVARKRLSEKAPRMYRAGGCGGVEGHARNQGVKLAADAFDSGGVLRAIGFHESAHGRQGKGSSETHVFARRSSEPRVFARRFVGAVSWARCSTRLEHLKASPGHWRRGSRQHSIHVNTIPPPSHRRGRLPALPGRRCPGRALAAPWSRRATGPYPGVRDPRARL